MGGYMNSNQYTLNYYNTTAQAFTASTIKVVFTEIQSTFLSYLPPRSHILDFGCGSGRDTKYFLAQGHQVDATDGSEELCKIAGEYTGIPVKQMLFEELDGVEEYDGIWACASILHVAKAQLPEILQKMTTATKKGGIIYASFKYGDFEGEKNGRFFTYLTEGSFEELIKDIPELKIEKMWTSTDVRADRADEMWLNIILRRTA